MDLSLQVGKYDVRLSYPPNADRATNVPVTVKSGDQMFVKKVNQRAKPEPERSHAERSGGVGAARVSAA